jgi:positive regulator of sigma E activity
MKTIFRFLADMLNGAERSILDLLSAIVPYAVPVIPAYLTYYHTQDMMGFPSWVAMTAAFVVEALGMTSVSTAIRFWRNNQRYTSAQNKAPFKLAILVYAFYIVIVLSVNVILEMVAGTRGGWIILSIALFTMLSFPSGVLISIRAQYSEMLEDRAAPKQKQGNQSEPQQAQGKQRTRRASEFKQQMITMLDQEYSTNNRVLELTEITSRLRLDHSNSKGFVSTVRSNWMQEKGIQKSRKDGLTF